MTAHRWLTAVLLEAARYLTGSEQSRIRQLKALRTLDERLLADIGLTPAEARRGRASPKVPDLPASGLAETGPKRFDGRGRLHITAPTSMQDA